MPLHFKELADIYGRDTFVHGNWARGMLEGTGGIGVGHLSPSNRSVQFIARTAEVRGSLLVLTRWFN